MASWTWKGGKAQDWFDKSNWITDSSEPYPQPGDEVTLDGPGNPVLTPGDPGGGALDDLAVDLVEGSLITEGTDFGPGFTLTAAVAGASNALTLSGGPVVFGGTIVASGSLSAFNIVSTATVAAGAFTLGDTGVIDVSNQDNVIARLGEAGSFVNDGVINVTQGSWFAVTAGALEGTGTVNLETAGFARFDVVGSGQTITMTGPNDALQIGDVGVFSGTITGFGVGDVLSLNNVVANGVSYDAAKSLLTITRDGAVEATLHLAVDGTQPEFHLQQGRGGTLITTSDASLAWNGRVGDWFTGMNWSGLSPGGNAVPQAGDKATIHGGTATISAAEAADGPIQAETITLASSVTTNPAILDTDNVTFGPDTVIRGGADYTTGTLTALGNTLFEGSMMATARAGALTLNIGNDGSAADFMVANFSDGTKDGYLNPNSSGSLIATQKGALQITGDGTPTMRGSSWRREPSTSAPASRWLAIPARSKSRPAAH